MRGEGDILARLCRRRDRLLARVTKVEAAIAALSDALPPPRGKTEPLPKGLPDPRPAFGDKLPVQDYDWLVRKLGVKKGTLAAWVHRGLLPCVRLGPRTLRFDEAEIDAWVAAGGAAAARRKQEEETPADLSEEVDALSEEELKRIEEEAEVEARKQLRKK